VWPFKSKPASAHATSDIDPELVAQALQNPNGWVYVIDGGFSQSAAVPPESIVGAWKVGPDGKITGEYKANSNYRAVEP